VDALTLARLHGVVRVLIGGAHVLAPARIPAAWVGRDARRAGVQVFALAFGARDAAIGGGVLTAGGPDAARPWVLAGAASDAADLLATLRSRDDLPRLAVAGVTALATTSTLLGLWLAREL